MSPRLSRGQLALRLLVLLGPLVALLSTGLVGVLPAGWLIALVAALAVAFAAMPDSPFGTAAMIVVLAWWGIALRDGLHPEALVAAAALVTAHVAALLASYGPAGMPVDRAVRRLWVRRGAVVLLVSPAVWALAAALRHQPEAPGVWVAGLAAAVSAVLVAAVAFQLDRRS